MGILCLNKKHIQTLEKDPNPCVLENTFYALEEISIKTIPNLNFISVGLLIPSYFTDGKYQSDNSFGVIYSRAQVRSITLVGLTPNHDNR